MPFPDLDPIALQLGPLPIRWYSLAYLAGAVFGAIYLLQLLKRPPLWGLKTRGPLNTDQLTDVATLAALGAIIGGRLGYVLFYDPSLLVAPWESLGSMMGGDGLVKTLIGWIPIPPALMMWRGGMSFHGGLIGVSIVGFFFSRKNKVDPLVLGDLFACAAPIGLFFGRIANFINGELYGRPWDGAWAMVFPADPLQVARHPSQLYEAALEGLILFIIIMVTTFSFGFLKKKGATIGVFLAGYGLARIIVENFREPDAHLAEMPLGLTMGMILSTPMVLAGLWLIRRAHRMAPTPIAEAPPPEAPAKKTNQSAKPKTPAGKAGRS
ncbi:MAG: prolipoprotein diacylglyceryl transferase [Pseudomonadota bacterium]